MTQKELDWREIISKRESEQAIAFVEGQVRVSTETLELRQKLLTWWTHHQREFPWRNTRNPYHVLLAEVLLHRTRADQVVPLYRAVLERYPTLADLAIAVPEAVRSLLHSGGLRWRIDLLLDCTRIVQDQFGGQIPHSSAELQSLPGIGHYIASAVRCFAFSEADPVIDTNTVRVLGRVYGLRITDGLRRNKSFHELAREVLDPEQPREFNFALLDLAALICKPQVPKCSECPIQPYCLYGQTLPAS